MKFSPIGWTGQAEADAALHLDLRGGSLHAVFIDAGQRRVLDRDPQKAHEKQDGDHYGKQSAEQPFRLPFLFLIQPLFLLEGVQRLPHGCVGILLRPSLSPQQVQNRQAQRVRQRLQQTHIGKARATLPF